jgi:RNA 2',3'-cyclic 3'-phosphodiesterase
MPRPGETWRVFIAIELPSHLRERIINHIDHLRSAIPEVRASWIREDTLHLTLKFLGDIPVANVEQLSAAAGMAASKVEPFEVVVEGCGAFPLRGQPRVLWIGIEDPSGNLAELQQALEQECDANGFAREPRPFHPHLTIARLRQPHGSRQLAQMHQEIGFNREAISVADLTVIRSELRSEGARHTVISRHGLTVG